MTIKDMMLTEHERSCLSVNKDLKSIEAKYDRLCEELVRVRLDLGEASRHQNVAERELEYIKTKLQELIARI